MKVTTIGIDLAKSVFGVPGVDGKTSFPAWTEFVYTNENACFSGRPSSVRLS